MHRRAVERYQNMRQQHLTQLRYYMLILATILQALVLIHYYLIKVLKDYQLVLVYNKTLVGYMVPYPRNQKMKKCIV